MAQSPVDILDFWFGTLDDANAFPSALLHRWFSVDHDFDQTIRERFGPLVRAAGDGRYSTWQTHADGALALVILLDQFTRNVFRGSARTIEFDALARDIAEHALNEGFDCLVHPVQSAFFYLPFEHAEDLESQERAVILFRMLQRRVDEQNRSRYTPFVDASLAHRDIIARFGRFPHRNEVLGRRSTPAELRFLQLPGSSF